MKRTLHLFCHDVGSNPAIYAIAEIPSAGSPSHWCDFDVFITMSEVIPPSTLTLGFLRQEAHRTGAILIFCHDVAENSSASIPL